MKRKSYEQSQQKIPQVWKIRMTDFPLEKIQRRRESIKMFKALKEIHTFNLEFYTQKKKRF